MENKVEKLTEFYLEQAQKSTSQMFDVMKNSVTSTAEVLTWAQKESQQVVDHVAQQAVDKFVSQLEQIKEQQVTSQKELQEQFQQLFNLFKQQA